MIKTLQLYETIKPIQRIYKDIKFRSSLETRWAIFFDLLEWEWTYEPIGIKNKEISWYPDFLIKGYDGDILVEVKPYSCLEEFREIYETKYAESLNNTKYQLNEVLLLGNNIFKTGSTHKGPYLGWIIERTKHTWDEKIWSQYEDAIFWYQDGKYGFASDNSCWHCRITNAYNGGSGINSPSYSQVFQLWIQAGNKVYEQKIYTGSIPWTKSIIVNQN